MRIDEAQGDVRRVYRGGFVGQLVSGALWLIAAAIASWVSPAASIATLFFGGMLIFPLTTLALRAAGGPTALPNGHPMTALATQIAFTVPAGMLVAVALGVTKPNLFFPASMIIVGAHYLPFVFLYGMRLFAVLAAILILCGALLLLWFPMGAPFGGWFAGALLILFAFLLRASASSFNVRRVRN
ncbi:hypothetical protein RCH16_003502 [Cryobacterium sp. MP_M5]|uniref:DUF7010 family protein n=1 Tax=unclassified Cryobacterium TaxID=2649013 RepID=UPI0018CAEA03|nr:MULTISPECIES: hypothetical protein [unclassified Cryobacterium]MBG6060059.1 hypothetical protein [Cryobacterium sp. MP_M3]MEC5178463.1 hypothetical protein [Cryobacterium sp. MP_M5]